MVGAVGGGEAGHGVNMGLRGQDLEEVFVG